MARLTARQSGYLHRTILPYLGNATDTFSAVSGRVLGALDIRIAQAREGLDLARSRFDRLLSQKTAFGLNWAQQFKASLGIPSDFAQLLGNKIMTEFYVIRPNIKDEAKIVNAVPQMMKGAFKWLKEKTEDYIRLNDDPDKVALTQARTRTLEYINLTWIGAANQAAQSTLNASYAAFAAYCSEIRAAALTVHQQLAPDEVIPDAINAFALSGAPDISLWNASAGDQLCNTPLAASIELGTVEEVARRGATNFAAACESLINSRIASITRELPPASDDTERFSALLDALEQKYHLLCEQRAQLAEEGDMLMRLLTPKEDAPEEDASTEESLSSNEADAGEEPAAIKESTEVEASAESEEIAEDVNAEDGQK